MHDEVSGCLTVGHKGPFGSWLDALVVDDVSIHLMSQESSSNISIVFLEDIWLLVMQGPGSMFGGPVVVTSVDDQVAITLDIKSVPVVLGNKGTPLSEFLTSQESVLVSAVEHIHTLFHFLHVVFHLLLPLLWDVGDLNVLIKGLEEVME